MGRRPCEPKTTEQRPRVDLERLEPVGGDRVVDSNRLQDAQKALIPIGVSLAFSVARFALAGALIHLLIRLVVPDLLSSPGRAI